MKYLNLNSIIKKLTLLVMLAILPALVIILYSGIEQRRQAIENAKKKVFLLTHTMAENQKEIAHASRQILSTLSILPSIQSLDIPASSEIFRAILEKNPSYNNVTLIDLKGEVLASGKSFSDTNLLDRKHVRDALESKDFAAGEYIISRLGPPNPVFPFAYPVFDKMGHVKAILTTTIKLTSFSHLYDVSSLPEKSFVGVSDHRGIRVFYYPAQNTTNPVGKAIKSGSWEIAKQAKEPGIFINTASDGLRRIFAFEQVRLNPDEKPYSYIWAGIPEAYIIAPANAALTRNLLFMLLASAMALFLSWLIGRNTLVAPIKNLVNLTRNFAEGNLEARCESLVNNDEFGTLANAFYEMAETLSRNRSIQNELIKNLETALAEIKTLQGILPICSICKKIRNDEGYYEQIESYIHKQTGVDFSHTICMPCMKKHYPAEYEYISLKKKG